MSALGYDHDPAARRVLGGSELTVPRLGFGTAPLASVFWENDPDRGMAAVRHAVERGITFFDTAPFYGLGESEERLGAALQDAGATELTIATKVGRLLHGTGSEREAHFDFSYDAAMRSLEESLRRLRVDSVGIVHIHDPDDHLPEALAGSYRALAELRDQGVIQAISVGTMKVDTLLFFAERARFDCFLVAGRYTLLDTSAQDELFTVCEDRGIGILAAGVFNSGVLADPRDGSWFDYAPASPDVLERARAMATTCAAYDTTLRNAALHFPFTHPAVTSVVVGMSSPDEVDANLTDLTQPLPDDLFADLKEIRDATS